MYQAGVTGNVALADALLARVQSIACGEDSQDIARLRGYLVDNACGLADYRLSIAGDGLRGLGAIEGNVDKLIATRMKKRGMSWTRCGGNRMARLINLRESGQLHCWINHPPKKPNRISLPENKAHIRWRCVSKHSGGWLEANLPALYGPHGNRPWARALWPIAHKGLEV